MWKEAEWNKMRPHVCSMRSFTRSHATKHAAHDEAPVLLLQYLLLRDAAFCPPQTKISHLFFTQSSLSVWSTIQLMKSSSTPGYFDTKKSRRFTGAVRMRAIRKTKPTRIRRPPRSRPARTRNPENQTVKTNGSVPTTAGSSHDGTIFIGCARYRSFPPFFVALPAMHCRFPRVARIKQEKVHRLPCGSEQDCGSAFA